MSIIGEAIEDWKKGLFRVFLLILIGIMGPIMMVTLLSLLIIIPSMIIGLKIDFWNNYSEDIAFVAVIALGPYFIGRYWEQITRP